MLGFWMVLILVEFVENSVGYFWKIELLAKSGVNCCSMSWQHDLKECVCVGGVGVRCKGVIV